MRAQESVLLPDPLGPITACTSPLSRASETPFRISRPSTLTCRLRILKSAKVLPLSRDLVGAARIPRREPGGAGHGSAQEPLVDVLLVPAGVAGADRLLLDGTVAVPELEAAVGPFHQLGHVSLLGGQPGQLPGAVPEVEPHQPGRVLRLQPARPQGEEP